jgi:hypothetical protein
VTFNGNYGFVEEEQAAERGYCLGNAVELRFPVPPRVEKSYCLVQEIQSSGKVIDDAAAAAAAPAGFPCDAPLHEAHKKEDVLSYGGRLEMGGVQAEALCGRGQTRRSKIKCVGAYGPSQTAVRSVTL